MNLLLFVAALSGFGSTQSTKLQNVAILGDLRVQCLSPTLVRLEIKGPRGFEDRPTFTVVNRNWPGVLTRVERNPQGTILSTPLYRVRIPTARKGLRGITVEALNGSWKYAYDGLPRPRFLPAPGELKGPCVVADSPRLIPPKGGAIPKPEGSPLAETSGYDTGNDAPDVYVFASSGYEQLRSDFLQLTGPIPMVPKYALGFFDSRYYPYTEAEALDTIAQYRKRKIPLDLLVVDTDWRIGGSKGYTPNPKYFPDMPGFLKKAHDLGVKVMFNDHPEPTTPSALDPAETLYRFKGLTGLFDIGLDVWWYDRNWVTSLAEPMPGIRREVWGQSVFHDVTLAARPKLRPLIMTNVEGIDNGALHYAPHPAGHRYPIWWTGDTQSSWPALKTAIANSVSSGVTSLLPYVHEDLGGHVGQPSPELYVRYLQYGALSPIMRVHCTMGRYRDPWRFGPEAEHLASEAIQFRYRLIPTLYSAAALATRTGIPLVRRLDLEAASFPEAKSTDQYVVGSDLLVAPVTQSYAAQAESVKDLLHAPTGEAGLKAEYFAGKELAGAPLKTMTVEDLNFDWGGGSPDPAVPNDLFSARWSGTLGPIPETREYTFSLTTDDGARLFIDDKPVINAWSDQDSETLTGKVKLEKGKSYAIRVEYFENAGQARFRLGWSGNHEDRATVESNVWLPPGRWVDLWTEDSFVGPRTVSVSSSLAKVPMFVREGGIVMLGSDAQTTAEQATKPLHLHAFVPSVAGASERSHYDDDGSTNDYLSGKSATRLISMQRSAKNFVTLLVGEAKGEFDSSQRFVVHAHLPKGAVATDVRLDGVLTPHLEKRPQHAPRGLMDLFQPQGSQELEINIGLVPKATSHRITFRVQAARGN